MAKNKNNRQTRIIQIIFASIIMLSIILALAGQQAGTNSDRPAPSESPVNTGTMPPRPFNEGSPVSPDEFNRAAVIKFDKVSINAYVADNDRTRTGGLSEWPQLGEKQGMLFVFDDYRARNFWMKGMQFPLDFIWIRNKKVADITHNVQHPPKDAEDHQINRAGTGEFVNMVLEVNGGFARKHDIKVGDTIDIQYIYKVDPDTGVKK